LSIVHHFASQRLSDFDFLHGFPIFYPFQVDVPLTSTFGWGANVGELSRLLCDSLELKELTEKMHQWEVTHQPSTLHDQSTPSSAFPLPAIHLPYLAIVQRRAHTDDRVPRVPYEGSACGSVPRHLQGVSVGFPCRRLAAVVGQPRCNFKRICTSLSPMPPSLC
jgi:hypothetical protein